MEQFTVHTLESAPAGSREPLAALAQHVGFLPNLAATMAESPTLLGGFTGLGQRLGGSSLSALEREVVALTVSFENASTYAMAAHSTFAQRHGADGEVIAALRAGQGPPDARLRALHAFTRALLRSRGHVAAGDVAALLASGYTRAQLLEVIAQASYTSMANWTANLAGTPVDEAFDAQRWATIA